MKPQKIKSREDAEQSMAALASASGMAVPKPLSGLDERPVRFPEVTEKADMRAVVDAFLAS